MTAIPSYWWEKIWGSPEDPLDKYIRELKTKNLDGTLLDMEPWLLPQARLTKESL